MVEILLVLFTALTPNLVNKHISNYFMPLIGRVIEKHTRFPVAIFKLIWMSESFSSIYAILEKEVKQA